MSEPFTVPFSIMAPSRRFRQGAGLGAAKCKRDAQFGGIRSTPDLLLAVRVRWPANGLGPSGRVWSSATETVDLCDRCATTSMGVACLDRLRHLIPAETAKGHRSPRSPRKIAFARIPKPGSDRRRGSSLSPTCSRRSDPILDPWCGSERRSEWTTDRRWNCRHCRRRSS